MFAASITMCLWFYVPTFCHHRSFGGQEYALHLESANVPTLITENVPRMQRCRECLTQLHMGMWEKHGETWGLITTNLGVYTIIIYDSHPGADRIWNFQHTITQMMKSYSIPYSFNFMIIICKYVQICSHIFKYVQICSNIVYLLYMITIDNLHRGVVSQATNHPFTI